MRNWERRLDVGFTGTRGPLTDVQVHEITMIFDSLGHARLHHGDCVGADTTAHRLAVARGWDITIHPCTLVDVRAFCAESIVPTTGELVELEPKEPMERNLDIAVACDLLIAAPKGNQELRRSGTWSTVRRARLAKRRIIIAWPSGRVTKESR